MCIGALLGRAEEVRNSSSDSRIFLLNQTTSCLERRPSSRILIEFSRCVVLRPQRGFPVWSSREEQCVNHTYLIVPQSHGQRCVRVLADHIVCFALYFFLSWVSDPSSAEIQLSCGVFFFLRYWCWQCHLLCVCADHDDEILNKLNCYKTRWFCPLCGAVQTFRSFPGLFREKKCRSLFRK